MQELFKVEYTLVGPEGVDIAGIGYQIEDFFDAKREEGRRWLTSVYNSRETAQSSAESLYLGPDTRGVGLAWKVVKIN